jgi:uncharacterized protein
VYAVNLRQKLLQPPVKGKVVLAVDPGLRTGCKVAVVSSTGVVLDFTTLMLPLGGKSSSSSSSSGAAVKELLALLRKYKVELVAIGNGTGCREATALVVSALENLNLEKKDEDGEDNDKKEEDEEVMYTIVDESGASVYSASVSATKELPDLDVTIRGAVSLARRLQDPLSGLFVLLLFLDEE